jgi:hypothetical protein
MGMEEPLIGDRSCGDAGFCAVFFMVTHQHSCRAANRQIARLYAGAYADPFGLSSGGVTDLSDGRKAEDLRALHGGLTPFDWYPMINYEANSCVKEFSCKPRSNPRYP